MIYLYAGSNGVKNNFELLDLKVRNLDIVYKLDNVLFIRQMFLRNERLIVL